MNIIRRYGIWLGVALVGAICWGVLALSRGETVNAGWLLFAAIASYAIAYRFYARFIQKKVLETDDSRATPAERLNNGRDFEPMDRRVLFGHHFAAIAGVELAVIEGHTKYDGELELRVGPGRGPDVEGDPIGKH